MSDIIIQIRKNEDFVQFLGLNGFEVETLEEGLYRVTRDGEIPIFIRADSKNLFFELDLGNINEIGSEALYFKLLDLNTEIVPVSLGINNVNPDDPRLVLVESRECGDLNDQELLAVFDAMELAVDKVSEVLSEAMSQK